MGGKVRWWKSWLVPRSKRKRERKRKSSKGRDGFFVDRETGSGIYSIPLEMTLVTNETSLIEGAVPLEHDPSDLVDIEPSMIVLVQVLG